jgi:glycosyltransferase involved in cell wall biosynthesis
MQVSVVIPSLNSPMIDRTVASIQAQRFDGAFEIIVVGLDREGLVPGNVRFISTGQPVGPAAARNMGIEAAQGEVICFIDADCEAAPDWMSRLVERWREGWGVVGGAVGLPDKHYWAVCDNVVAFRHFMRLSPPGKRRYVPTISLCAARETLLRAGGFDERFATPAGEDIDLCLKIAKLGLGIYFEPGAVVYHHHRRLRPRDTWRRFTRYGAAWAQIRLKHGQEWTRFGRCFRAIRKHPAVMIALAPLATVYNVIYDCSHTPQVLARYWYTLPAFVLSNLAWAWGAYRHLSAARRGDANRGR